MPFDDSKVFHGIDLFYVLCIRNDIFYYSFAFKVLEFQIWFMFIVYQVDA